jgi:3'-5' exoribonuclease
MSKKKPVLMKLADLRIGDYADCFVQLAEWHRKTLPDGKPFLICRFRDGRRTVSAAPIWGDGPLFAAAQAWGVGQFFKVRAYYTEHEKYGPQLEIEQIRPVEDRDRADGFAEHDFIEHSRHDPEAMWAELESLVNREIGDRPLRTLVFQLLAANASRLKALPASARHYYPFAGGWLEHTLSVAQTVAWLAERYATMYPELKPPLNRGLAVAAAVLHDLGRVRELEAPLGQPVKDTVEGELFGHVFLAYDMIRTAAGQVADLNPELRDLLLHCVVAHLMMPHWGTTRQPCIPEVLILHHADDLDAKMEMFVRCLTRDTADGPFTERDPIVGRPLLKRRSV